jgi:hypothetical protein
MHLEDRQCERLGGPQLAKTTRKNLRCTIAPELFSLDGKQNTKAAFWYLNARINLVTPMSVTMTEKRSQEFKNYFKKNLSSQIQVKPTDQAVGVLNPPGSTQEKK